MKGTGMPNFISSRALRLLKWITAAIVVLIILLIVGGRLLSSYISAEAREKFEQIGGTVGTLEVNLFNQSITINDIDFIDKGSSDSVVASTARIENVVLKNINIYRLVAKKDLRIGDVLVTKGNIVINRNPIQKDTVVSQEDSVVGQDEESVRNIYLDRVKLADVHLSVVSDSVKEYSGIINATLNGLKSADTAGVADIKSYTLEDIELDITKLVISAPKLYSVEIANLAVNSTGSTLTIDSLTLIPKFAKFKFAEVVGKQTDRINAFVRSLEIDGLQYGKLKDSALVASKVKIMSAQLHSFRDKRQPFKETKVKPLPIAALKSLPYAVAIDTIEITDARIGYEEFSPEGFEAGTIIFEELNAILTNLTNRDGGEVDHATLAASAKLMGHGRIDATFQLPYREGEPYLAKGKIGEMSLDHLNQPLQNLAFIRVQSGTLQGLAFNFSYTDKASTGKVTINYQDLKIDGLKKEKSTVINDLKTLLINTVIKNDKDKDVPLEKRTGNIDFERDRMRQIFNYWWKSLFSGIKSSVMDK